MIHALLAPSWRLEKGKEHVEIIKLFGKGTLGRLSIIEYSTERMYICNQRVYRWHWWES